MAIITKEEAIASLSKSIRFLIGRDPRPGTLIFDSLLEAIEERGELRQSTYLSYIYLDMYGRIDWTETILASVQ